MIALLLLGLIVAVFFFQIAIPQITPLLWLNPATLSSQPWTIITSMFLHAGYLHLFFNGFALYMFGPYLERMIGSNRFLVLYFAAGIAGALAYAATFYAGILPQSIPALGASGAIFGILGAVAVLRPNLMIFVWFVPMPMKFAALLWVGLSLLETVNISGGIAGAAHLGGLVMGALTGYYLLKTGDVHADASGY
ncbi:MAG: rhomboid family intramembrane serine protease [Candidatus Micrarchaeota archaeon]|nr:rhomboid family intramembrane serine protease [Candidatus Micrarchaeota archaeon]